MTAPLRRLMGLDVGTVRIGVALSDPLGFTAQPLLVVERRRPGALDQLRELVHQHEVERVIVGRPIQLNGQEGLAVQSVEAFVAQLLPYLGNVPVEYLDERLTTKQATRMMIESGARRETRKKNVDKIAAAILLQSYLDAHRA